jgi:predicted ATPase
VVYVNGGDVTAAYKFNDATIHLAEEQGFQELLAYGIANRGWVQVASGRPEEGIIQLRQGLRLDSLPKLARPGYLALLALGYWIVGRVDEGFATIAEAMALVESTGARVNEAILYWVKGELTLNRSEAGSNSKIKEQAESYFRQAIEIARRQSAKLLELVATTSLARLLAEQGRRDEARTLLAEIYNWFSEGFDTVNLKTAKALLDELRR